MEVKILKDGRFDVKLSNLPDKHELSWVNKLANRGRDYHLEWSSQGTKFMRARNGIVEECPFFEWFTI